MKNSPEAFIQAKSQQPIPMLTAYTTPVAKAIERAGIPVILVGDSVGMVEMGFGSTRDVTMDHMAYHVGAVHRGAPNTHIIGDLPYLADSDPETALHNAKRLIDAGADSIKLEGLKTDIIACLVENNIPVVGHTGLTPQTAANFKKVGGTEKEATRVLDEAKAIEAAGAFMLVIEHVPGDLATNITKALKIPTIGIGAGPNCDGQVLVINDVLGMGDYWPPFSKQYAKTSETLVQIAKQYAEEVRLKRFPN
jgi:3-methyl-2-oxobutanoate hydroxymethyltransferase